MSSELKAPWFAHYGNVPHSVDYPKATMFELVERAAEKTPDYIAYDFEGTTATYSKFVEDVHTCAKASDPLTQLKMAATNNPLNIWPLRSAQGKLLRSQ